MLILLATQDRKFGATCGYGLEPILPDGKVGGFRPGSGALCCAAAIMRARSSLMTSAIADRDRARCGSDAGQSAATGRASAATCA